MKRTPLKDRARIRNLEREIERLRNAKLPLEQIVFKPSQKLPGTPFGKVLAEAISKKGWKARLSI